MVELFGGIVMKKRRETGLVGRRLRHIQRLSKDTLTTTAWVRKKLLELENEYQYYNEDIM